MNILYLTNWEISETSGVFKKIIAQQKALDRLGHTCSIIFVSDTSKGTLYSKENFIEFNIDYINVKDLVNNFDVCYVRFELFCHKYYKIIFSECNKAGIPIILEIPTFPPYEESMARVREKLNSHNYIGALKTRLGVIRVKHDLYKQIRFASLVCNNGNSTEFRWTKTIRIENGIDFEQNPYIQRNKKENIIEIIAVSNFAIWNGYDLAIEGLHNYIKLTGRRDIHISFVGDKKLASSLISMVKEFNLEDCIKFTGLLGGDDLNSAYSKADVALGALGDHRRKAFSNSSLKAKEYAARGLLMILSESEGIDSQIKRNSFIVPAKDCPVDFCEFKRWYNECDALNISENTFSFAKENYSWDIQMQYIISELNVEINH